MVCDASVLESVPLLVMASVPEPKALSFATESVAAFKMMPPEKVFEALSTSVPPPMLVASVPDPAITPLIVPLRAVAVCA